MAETFRLDLVTPERMIVSKNVDMVVIPGSEGDFGVLTNHSPMVSSLRPGVLRIFDGDQVSERFLISHGVAEVNSDHCTILATEAYDLDDKCPEQIAKRLTAARKAHDKAQDEIKKAEALAEISLAEQLVAAVDRE